MSGSRIVRWTILLEHRSRPDIVAGTCTHRPVSHDLNSILWSLLYRAKHYSLRQVSGGWSGNYSREGRTGTSCPHDSQRRLPPGTDGLMCLGQTSVIGFKCCLWLLYVPYDPQGDEVCRTHGEHPQVGSREAEMNVLTFVRMLAGFTIYGGQQ